MQVVLGHSDHIDTIEAVNAAMEACARSLNGDAPKAVLLHATVEYDLDRLVARVRERWPEAEIAGCSVDGAMSSAQGYLEDSVQVLALAGSTLRAKSVLASQLAQECQSSIERALAGSPLRSPRLAFVFASMDANCSDVVRVVQDQLGPDCVVVGGVSADHHEFSHGREFCGSEVSAGSASILLLEGDFHVSTGVESGWFPIGESFEVTAAAGKVVSKISGQDATTIYQEHWGDMPAASLNEFPLAVYEDAQSENFYMRAATGYTDDGALLFAGDVPQSAVVRITEVMPDGILAGSTASIERAIKSYSGSSPSFALILSCSARKCVLGTQASGECKALAEGLGKHGLEGLSFGGGYFFGELAPTVNGGGSVLHNETCVSVILGT